MCIHMYMCIYIYVYIYTHMCVCDHICMLALKKRSLPQPSAPARRCVPSCRRAHIAR